MAFIYIVAITWIGLLLTAKFGAQAVGMFVPAGRMTQSEMRGIAGVVLLVVLTLIIAVR